MPESLLRTTLYDCHLESGARMVPFAGYEMPVQYQSIVAEAKAVRSAVGMFDVGHMARLTLDGPDSLAFLEHVTSNDVAKLGPMRGQYSLLTNDRGGCVDDLIVYCVEESRYRLIVNAANHEKDVAWLRAHLPASLNLQDQTLQTGLIAVQGPAAVATLARLCSQPQALAEAPNFGCVEADFAGVPCFAARSGYTGEDGCELICPAQRAPVLWRALLAQGVAPCGLGARDVLRVEAGLPLYGHELADDLSPIAAGLGWVVGKTKDFIGAGPIRRAQQEGTEQKLLGIKLESKRLLAPGMPVFIQSEQKGEITSGVFSPLLDTSIAMAFLDPGVQTGTPCEVDVRGKREPGIVANKRFFKRQA